MSRKSRIFTVLGVVLLVAVILAVALHWTTLKSYKNELDIKRSQFHGFVLYEVKNIELDEGNIQPKAHYHIERGTGNEPADLYTVQYITDRGNKIQFWFSADKNTKEIKSMVWDNGDAMGFVGDEEGFLLYRNGEPSSLLKGSNKLFFDIASRVLPQLEQVWDEEVDSWSKKN